MRKAGYKSPGTPLREFMVKGKSLFLDIGTDSIKAVEITKTPDRIILSDSLTINEAKRYLSVYGVENMEGLINCIVDALEEHEITAKAVYIVSSALRIESKLEVVSDTDTRRSKEEKKDNTTISSRQVYGSLTYADRITTASVVSSGDIYTLRSLAEAFDARGYQVMSIEDSLTAVMNLVKLNKYTYDYPGKVIISFGGTTRYICYNKDCPVSINEYEAKISDMILRIAESTGMTYQEINTLFFKYGLIMSDKAVREIVQCGLDPNGYFATVRSCCLSYIQQFKEVVDAECESRMMGRCYIIVTGGYADVPGLYDMLEHEFCDEFKILLRNAIPRTYENDYLMIQNRTGRTDLGAVYGTCTGLILKDMFKASVNLLPKYSRSAETENLTAGVKKVMLATGAIAIVCVMLLLLSSIKYMVTPKMDQESGDLTAEYTIMKAQEAALDQQLETIRSLNKTGKDLVDLCNEFSNGLLTITSIDSADILQESSSTSTTAVEETGAAEGEADAESGEEQTANPAAQEPVVEEKTSYKTTDYIIRGIAGDPSCISSFYNSILSNGYIGRAAMTDGIRKADLNSGETMYVFEIVVSAKNN